MKVLIACEESQAICIAFRNKGHEAYSCDILPCSGGYSEWHLQMDCFDAIKLKKWDMMIAHPPCTYLTVSANKWYKDQPPRKSGALVGQERRKARTEAIDFFNRLVIADVPKIAIENPIGIMSSIFRKPDQIIQPYQFGDPFTKTTCLWLKKLPVLLPTQMVDKGEKTIFKSGKSHPKWYADAFKLSPKERAIARSKTFPGIAAAMAEQWG